MGQENSEQGWSELEARISQFVGRLLQNEPSAHEHQRSCPVRGQSTPEFRPEEMERRSSPFPRGRKDPSAGKAKPVA